MKPVVAWAGGKRQISEKVLDLFPKDYEDRTYHEPMIGGGAIFFEVMPSNGSINDVNPDLINFYRAVKEDPQRVINEMQNHDQESEEYYYEKREKFNDEDLGRFERAGLFLYFNKTAFNSLWRVNQNGGFNVPYGDPKSIDPEGIKKTHKVLQDIDIHKGDFGYIIEKAEKGDIVYFDPPYPGTKDSPQYNKYTEKKFDLDEQRRVSKACKVLDEKGVYFVVSNALTPEIEELFEEEFHVQELETKRWIGSKNSCKNSAKEVLITNVPEKKRRD